MSLIKTFLVGNGGMSYINHNNTNFSIIDCNLVDREEEIINELKYQYDSNTDIIRFISTHPDEDHIGGIEKIDDAITLINFYCVDNTVTKKIQTESFKRYQKLRDGSRCFKIEKDCTRYWLNQSKDGRGSAGISILWPDTQNTDFKEALNNANEGSDTANNISAIIKYSLEGGVTALWMGDLESEYMEKIEDEVEWPMADILFAPHHGRETGKIPSSILQKINPKVIILGHAKSEYMDYYTGYNTIKRTHSGDIEMYCENGYVDFYCVNENYSEKFLCNRSARNVQGNLNYIGSIETYDN